MISSGKTFHRIVWRIYFLLAFLQSLAALIGIFVNQSMSGEVLFGLSFERLLIMVPVLFSGISFVWFLIWSLRNPHLFDKRIERLAERLSRPRNWTRVILILLIFSLGGFYFISVTPEISEPFTRAYFDRLLPIVIYITGMTTQTLLALLFTRTDGNPIKKVPENKLFFIILIISTGILLTWTNVASIWLPRESKITGWNIPTAPVLETQVLATWIICTTLFILASFFFTSLKSPSLIKKINPQGLDILICLFLWLGAIILWQSVPIDTNWFVTDPALPNYEYYPSSDARQYNNTAESALIGEGYVFLDSRFIRRPFHATYLTFLHVIGGQDYESIISLQIIVLALLPPFIYLLTKALHQRLSGVIAALLIMLREANAIAVGGRITTSHAKLLLVDLLTTLIVVIFTYLAVIWLKEAERKKSLALIAGGVLGAAMLIRLETFVFYFVLLLIAALQLLNSHSRTQWVKGFLLISLGVALMVSPWIYRNWKLTGEVFIDSPYWRSDLINQRFQPREPVTPSPPEQTPEIAPSTATSESAPIATAPDLILTSIAPDLEFTPTSPEPIGTASPVIKEEPSPTISPSDQAEHPEDGRELQGAVYKAWNFITQNPALVAQFFVTHYLNSQVQSLIILPTTFRPLDSLVAFLGHHSSNQFWFECCSVLDYVRRMPYWHRWDGRFPSQAIVPITLNLVFVAVGIQILWKKQRWIGLIPLTFMLVYFVLHAIFRNSGGRYILPIDWVSILYFAIGLGHLTEKIIGSIPSLGEKLSWQPTDDIPQPLGKISLLRNPKTYLLVGAILLVGSALPLTESAFPRQYTDERKTQMINTLLQSENLSPEQRQAMQTFLSKGGEASVGRGLYPIYLPAGAGDVLKFKLEVRSYPRLNFYLLGPRSQFLVVPTVNRPSYFPNGAEIVVLHCPGMEVLNQMTDVLVVGIFNPSGSLEALVPRFPISPDSSCPLPWP